MPLRLGPGTAPVYSTNREGRVTGWRPGIIVETPEGPRPLPEYLWHGRATNRAPLGTWTEVNGEWRLLGGGCWLPPLVPEDVPRNQQTPSMYYPAGWWLPPGTTEYARLYARLENGTVVVYHPAIREERGGGRTPAVGLPFEVTVRVGESAASVRAKVNIMWERIVYNCSLSPAAREDPIVFADVYVGYFNPESGSMAGGNRVTIVGINFRDVTSVRFGSTPATSFSVVNPQLIYAVAPPHTAERVQITVTTVTDSDRSFQFYTYY